MNVEYRCLMPVAPGQGSYRFNDELVCGQKWFLPPGGTQHSCSKHDRKLSQVETYEGHLFEPTDVNGKVQHRPTTGEEVANPSSVETQEDLDVQEAALKRQLEDIAKRREEAPSKDDVPHLTPRAVQEVDPADDDGEVDEVPDEGEDDNSDTDSDTDSDVSTSEEDLWVPPIPENATKDQLRDMFRHEVGEEPDGRYSEDTLRRKIMEAREENMRAELREEQNS